MYSILEEFGMKRNPSPQEALEVIGKDQKRCAACRRILSLDCFKVEKRKNSSRIKSYCRECESVMDVLYKRRRSALGKRKHFGGGCSSLKKKAVTATLRREVKRGHITKKPCEVCGAKAEAHHHDYSKPLDVVWLCRKHHMAQHRTKYTTPIAAVLDVEIAESINKLKRG